MSPNPPVHWGMDLNTDETKLSHDEMIDFFLSPPTHIHLLVKLPQACFQTCTGTVMHQFECNTFERSTTFAA